MTDLKYGLRVLLKMPGFTAAAALCLALGIGANTAIFSVVYAVVMRPLPYTHSERLVRLYSEFPTFPNGGLRRFWISAPEYLDLKKETQAWESLDAWVNGGANLAGSTDPLRVTASYMTGGLLQSLGVSPIRGRLLTPEDDVKGAPQVAVISYGLWQRAFAADSAALGRETTLDGTKCTIVGIMPKGFQFPPGEVEGPELWTSLQLDPANPGNRGGHYLSLVGRLKDGGDFRKAHDEIDRRVNHWESTGAPNTHFFSKAGHPIVMYPLQEEVVRGVKPAMVMLMGAVGFVLLIACLNVANLLLARAEARHREIAVRTAMGAGRMRLVRQFITEGVILSLLGAGLGLLLAYGGLRLMTATSAGNIPRVSEIGMNSTVLLFTLLVSVATGIFFGLAPVVQVTSGNLYEALKSASGGRATVTAGTLRFRGLLVIGELGLALMLLIGSGLMVRAFWKLQEVNTGFVPSGLLTMRVALPNAIYKDVASTMSFWSRLEERIAELPGVESSTVMSGLPPQRPLNANDTQIEGFVPVKNGPLQNIDFWQRVGDKYFETMGIRLIEGRTFDKRDGPGATEVVVVNQTMARTYWKNESALGHRVKPGFQGQWRTIVGVVADVKNAALDKPAGAELYLPYRQQAQAALRAGNIVVKTKGDPLALAGAVRKEIAAVDSALPVANVRTMEDVLMAAQSRPRFLTLLMSLFSVVALALAALGIYGVISYSVAQRTSEFGIRMALGAQTGDVLGMVVGQGFRLGLLGVAVGVLGALSLTHLMTGLLFGVSSFDPATFLVMAAALVIVAVAASYFPARRATTVDPIVALRYE